MQHQIRCKYSQNYTNNEKIAYLQKMQHLNIACKHSRMKCQIEHYALSYKAKNLNSLGGPFKKSHLV
jgi:hypothetical protein